MVLPFLIPAAISIASEFFPGLATKLGGARGTEIAKKVVEMAASVAGVSPDASPQEIIAGVKAKPGARDQLTYDLEQLNLRETELMLEDRQNARSFQLQSGAKRGNYMLIGVSTALVACVLIIIVPRLAAHDPTATDAGLSPGELTFIATISGALLKMLSDAFAFEFGSSRGSKEKDEQAAELRDSILKLGQERQNADQEVIRSQEKRLGEAQTALTTSVPASVVATVTAQAADAASEAAQQTRDFVAQLVSGKLETS